jgi:hypothetical protein
MRSGRVGAFESAGAIQYPFKQALNKRLVALGALVVLAAYNSTLADTTPPPEGIVFAYGVRIDPPYVFEGLESDTLTLNGFPFRPARPTSRQKSPVEIFAQKMNEQLSQAQRDEWRHAQALVDSVYESLESDVDGVPATAQCTEVMRARFAASPLVESVTVLEDGCEVKFSFFPEPLVAMCPQPKSKASPRDGSSDFSEAEIRAAMMGAFQQIVAEGGFYAWGSGYMMARYKPGTEELWPTIEAAYGCDPEELAIEPPHGLLRGFWVDFRRERSRRRAEAR